MKDLYHLVKQENLWILRWESTSYPILTLNLPFHDAVEKCKLYVKTVGGRLLIHDEKGNVIEEVKYS